MTSWLFIINSSISATPSVWNPNMPVGQCSSCDFSFPWRVNLEQRTARRMLCLTDTTPWALSPTQNLFYHPRLYSLLSDGTSWRRFNELTSMNLHHQPVPRPSSTRPPHFSLLYYNGNTRLLIQAPSSGGPLCPMTWRNISRHVPPAPSPRWVVSFRWGCWNLYPSFMDPHTANLHMCTVM